MRIPWGILGVIIGAGLLVGVASAGVNSTWVQQTASADWTSRQVHTSVVLPNWNIVLMGGVGGGLKNDTWRSMDRGITWALMNGSSGWAPRHSHTSVALSDGSIVLMGGVIGSGYINDTWRSTDEGATWVQQNASGIWASRRPGAAAVALLNDTIVLMGGGSAGEEYYNDTWWSTDKGVTWINKTGTPGWTARQYLQAVRLPDDSIIITGGMDYYWGYDYLNDTWRSTDGGVTWVQQTEHAAWTARECHCSVARPDGSIFVMGGSSTDTGSDIYRNDVWGSTDQGVTWTELTDPIIDDPENPYIKYIGGAEWEKRDQFSCNALNDGSVIIMGGDNWYYYNDVWRYLPILANFTYTTNDLDVGFTDTSQGSPTGWAWYFGDEPYTRTWTQQSASAGWSGHYAPRLVALPDGSVILTGGLQDFGMLHLNETWRSINQGVTWTQINASSGWMARSSHGSAVLTDGSIVLMGGADQTYTFNDTWRSTDNGVTWYQMCSSCGWQARFDPHVVALSDGSVLMIGGRNTISRKNDTWRSTDNGITWVQQSANAGWRARVYESVAVLQDNSIILTGGWDSNNIYNDTWRSTDKGVTWQLMNASGGWEARIDHNLIAIPDGSIVLLGGTSNGGVSQAKNDVWRSTDQGATWTQLPDAGWDARFNQNSVVLTDGSILMVGGDTDIDPYDTSTWRLDTAGSHEQDPVKSFPSVGTYNVTLQVYNSATYNRTNKEVTISLGGMNRQDIVLGAGEIAMNITTIKSSTYYPHLVRLTCNDYMGKPISDVTVSAVVTESTAPYSWVTDMFGIDTNQTPVTNTTLIGTTDSDGAIVFLMVEDLKYKLDFSKADEDISQTSYLYPKESEYVYVFWTEQPLSMFESISIRFWTEADTDPTKMKLGVRYYDVGGTTDSLEFKVRSEDNVTVNYEQSSGTPNDWNVSYAVPMTKGMAYVWSIRANNTRYPADIVQSQVVRFGYSVPRIPFGDDLTEPWRQWIAYGVIFLVALLFGRATIKYASAIIVLLTLFFAVIGWLNYAPLLISTIVFLGIMFYVRYAEGESD
jgi:PKD repeat protein